MAGGPPPKEGRALDVTAMPINILNLPSCTDLGAHGVAKSLLATIVKVTSQQVGCARPASRHERKGALSRGKLPVVSFTQQLFSTL